MLLLLTVVVAATPTMIDEASPSVICPTTDTKCTLELATGPNSEFWSSPQRQLPKDSGEGAVTVLNVLSRPNLDTASTATSTDLSSVPANSPSPLLTSKSLAKREVTGTYEKSPPSVSNDYESTIASNPPTFLESREEKEVLVLTWPAVQKLRHQLYFHSGVKEVNGFLDKYTDFKKKCLDRADCSLAVAAIPLEEALMSLELDVAGLSPEKRCDEMCVMENIDQACSVLARNCLTRVAMIRNDMMGMDWKNDAQTYQRIGMFHGMIEPAQFSRDKRSYDRELRRHKMTAKPPTIGRSAVPDNSTFLDALLHDNVCSGDAFLCNLDPKQSLHMVGMLYAAMNSGVLPKDSVLLDTLKSARRGELSAPSFTVPIMNQIYGWLAKEGIPEVVQFIDRQRNATKTMNHTKFYWTESFNTSDGRFLPITLILDLNSTRAMHPALINQGYQFFLPFFGGHAFVRQTAMVRSTSANKWQPLRLGLPKIGPASNSMNKTAISPAKNTTSPSDNVKLPATPVRYTMPINEAGWLHDSLRGKDMPAYYPTDNRTRGSQDVQYQIRSGGGHLDSLGRPLMRAYMLGGTHPPILMSGDHVPWRASSSADMRFSHPVLKAYNASHPNTPEQAYNPSEPAANYIQVDGPIPIDEVLICTARVQQELFWKAPHNFHFGKALVIVDGSKWAKELSKKANSDSLATLPGASPSYAEIEAAWADIAAPASLELAQHSKHMNISRLQVIMAAVDAGYNVTLRQRKSNDPNQKTGAKQNSSQPAFPEGGGKGKDLTERADALGLVRSDLHGSKRSPPTEIDDVYYFTEDELYETEAAEAGPASVDEGVLEAEYGPARAVPYLLGPEELAALSTGDLVFRGRPPFTIAQLNEMFAAAETFIAPESVAETGSLLGSEVASLAAETFVAEEALVGTMAAEVGELAVLADTGPIGWALAPAIVAATAIVGVFVELGIMVHEMHKHGDNYERPIPACGWNQHRHCDAHGHPQPTGHMVPPTATPTLGVSE